MDKETSQLDLQLHTHTQKRAKMVRLDTAKSPAISYKKTHLDKLIGLPHPSRQIFQSDINSRYRLTAQQLSLIVTENTKRNAEEHIEAIDEEDIPHPEQSLAKIEREIINLERQKGTCDTRLKNTYLNR